MHTTCSHCQSQFVLTIEDLKQANGMVRCGQCKQVFNALESLASSVSDYQIDMSKISPLASKQATPIADPKTEIQPNPASNDSAKTPTPIQSASKAATKLSSRSNLKDDTCQENLTPYPMAKSRSSYVWLLASCFLVMLLGAQWLFFNYQSLSQQAQYRPLLAKICDTFSCQLPPLRAPEKLELIGNAQILSDSKVDNLLNFSLSYKNSSEFYLAHPKILLKLKNQENELVASRQFAPKSYLKYAELIPNSKAKRALAPEQELHLVLQLVDPKPEQALSFEVQFL